MIVWKIEDPAHVGGLATRVVGNPTAIPTPRGPAVLFDGCRDGIFLPVNPIAGWPRFTVEILFRPDAPGEFEQRFLHLGEADGARALIELRLTPEKNWYLDTFLESGGRKQPLIDPTLQHPAAQWYWAALRYDGRTMTHFVNGREEKCVELAIPPLPVGETSLGVRQTLVSWFHGALREVRFHEEALTPAALQRV